MHKTSNITQTNMTYTCTYTCYDITSGSKNKEFLPNFGAHMIRDQSCLGHKRCHRRGKHVTGAVGHRSPWGQEVSDGSLVELLWQHKWYVITITLYFKSQHWQWQNWVTQCFYSWPHIIPQVISVFQTFRRLREKVLCRETQICPCLPTNRLVYTKAWTECSCINTPTQSFSHMLWLF